MIPGPKVGMVIGKTNSVIDSSVYMEGVCMVVGVVCVSGTVFYGKFCHGWIHLGWTDIDTKYLISMMISGCEYQCSWFESMCNHMIYACTQKCHHTPHGSYGNIGWSCRNCCSLQLESFAVRDCVTLAWLCSAKGHQNVDSIEPS